MVGTPTHSQPAEPTRERMCYEDYSEKLISKEWGQFLCFIYYVPGNVLRILILIHLISTIR